MPLQPEALYPNCCSNILSATIPRVKVKHKKNLRVFENDCCKLFDDDPLAHLNLLF
jgi:hypothetical protein